jgi:hypothetical protein
MRGQLNPQAALLPERIPLNKEDGWVPHLEGKGIFFLWPADVSCIVLRTGHYKRNKGILYRQNDDCF